MFKEQSNLSTTTIDKNGTPQNSFGGYDEDSDELANTQASAIDSKKDIMAKVPSLLPLFKSPPQSLPQINGCENRKVIEINRGAFLSELRTTAAATSSLRSEKSSNPISSNPRKKKKPLPPFFLFKNNLAPCIRNNFCGDDESESISVSDLTRIIAEQWRWIEMASNIKAYYEEKYQQNLIQYNSISNADAI
jgi:hypothetical protein